MSLFQKYAQSGVELFQQYKADITQFAMLDRDSLHIYVGVLVFLVACLALRRKATSIWPWLVVLAVTLIGEWLDNQMMPPQDTKTNLGLLLDYHGKDIINTMLLPTLLALSNRYTRVFGR